MSTFVKYRNGDKSDKSKKSFVIIFISRLHSMQFALYFWCLLWYCSIEWFSWYNLFPSSFYVCYLFVFCVLCFLKFYYLFIFPLYISFSVSFLYKFYWNIIIFSVPFCFDLYLSLFLLFEIIMLLIFEFYDWNYSKRIQIILCHSRKTSEYTNRWSSTLKSNF